MIDWKHVWRVFQRVIVIISWAFWIGLVGYIGGSYISHFWEIGFATIGAIIGGLWGTRSNWLIC